MLWWAGHAQGAEPSPRFGHSCVSLSADDWLLPSVDNNTGKKQQEDVFVDRLVFTGGSNGNDLVRNGREIREVRLFVDSCLSACSLTPCRFSSPDSHTKYRKKQPRVTIHPQQCRYVLSL